MNVLDTCEIVTPYEDLETCAMFVIDNVLTPFTLHDITTTNQQYAFSLWIKSDNDGGLLVGGTRIASTAEWAKYAFTFTAKEVDLDWYFDTVGTYYIYHPQLENGNKSTDWSLSPEDVDKKISDAQETANVATGLAKDTSDRVDRAESLIQQLSDCISMLVTDGSGGSLMTQTENGWTFSMAETNDAMFALSESLQNLNAQYDSTSSMVEELKTRVAANEKIASYVRIDESGNQPLIELGTSEMDFRLRITNTSIQFLQGSDVIAYISNQKLHIPKAVIEEEMDVGGFVIKKRANGNVGWLWKGVTE